VKVFDMNQIPSSFGKNVASIEPATPRSGAFPLESRSEAQFLEELRVMQTNFLFMYGDHQAGKSAICASLIYYLMTHPESARFTDRVQQYDAGRAFIRSAVGKIAEKRFLARTPVDSVSLASGRLEPTNKKFASIPITFMEMAGEDLRRLVAPRGANSFPQHVDVFLSDKALSLVFILVVKHSTISHEKDLMLADFIDYLRSKDARFTNSRILLLVSQWDSYRGDRSVEEFAADYLPLTYASLTGRASAIAAYSVGDVATVDSQPYITRLDSQSPERLVRWIYRTVAGKDFHQRSWGQRLLDLLP
jgi:hypothetical protein